MANGVRHPEPHRGWLVPPWPANASFADVVMHFLAREPADRSNPAILAAYYLGYEAALNALPDDGDDWCRSMRALVARCAALSRGRA
ncbi:hypothetical protein [Actinophytocola sp.]|uniref:hypothetical protein n=1 Tax=Actinophytocola sp. TaxID=1872138 RepID=UPI002D7E5D25|nr:hypothetical protein [Actinophytocola sp.]HET9141877.1 hypothetical protein [Actinophytocola sp.]